MDRGKKGYVKLSRLACSFPAGSLRPCVVAPTGPDMVDGCGPRYPGASGDRTGGPGPGPRQPPTRSDRRRDPARPGAVARCSSCRGVNGGGRRGARCRIRTRRMGATDGVMGIADLGERRVQGPDEMRVGGRTGGCAGVRGSGTCRCRRCRCERYASGMCATDPQCGV